MAVIFHDISPDNSNLDATQPNGASMGRINGLASVGRQDLGTANNDIFYAATEWGGLYKTTDGGVNWSFLERHLPLATWDVEVDPADVNRVYATSFYDGRVNPVSGIQVSLDGGNSWIHPLTADPDPAFENTANDNTPQAGYTSANPRNELSAYGIAIQPDNTQNVFIGTSSGLARSTDAGATWDFISPDPTPATPPPAASDVWDVVAQAGGIVDVVTDSGHFRSLDGGNTWAASSLPAGAISGGMASIAASPDENYVLFVTSTNDQNVYESDDGGLNWASLGSRQPNSRIPMVVTNQKSDDGDGNDGFDLWYGAVSLYRATCTTPAAPAPSDITSGGGRCDTSGSWFGGFTRNGLGAGTGAHDDAGDIVFDTEAANDAIPMQFSNDGGVYRNTTNNASPTGLGDLVWEQPDVGPHAMWLYAMAGVDQPGADNEDLYFGLQDDGAWATRRAVPDNSDWDNVACCDVFDIVADDTRALFSLFSAFSLNLTDPGFQNATSINPPPNAGQQGNANFNFPDFLDQYGPNQYVAVTSSGMYITTDITASPVVWTQVGAGSTPAGGFTSVQVAMSGGTPTFYAQTTAIGVFEQQAPAQLWRYVGTGAGTWQRIDNNDGLTGGFGIFAVDPNDPNRLYASNFGGPAGIQMVFSTDGGTNWDVDTELDNLMTTGGYFRYQTQTGPTSFAHTAGFQGYAQPSLLAFDPENPNNIAAGGRDSGLFISSDSGNSWRLLTDPIDSGNTGVPHLPRPFYAYFDHEPFASNKVYIGTQGRGIWLVDFSDFDLTPDEFEPNNTTATATTLGSLPKITLRDLTIHTAADVDFFQYTAQDTGKLVINLLDDFNGVLDVRVRDATGAIIANGSQSDTTPGQNRQEIVIPVITQQQYFIEVYSSVAHTNEYDLEIENFAVPVPIAIDLSAADDTGMSNSDDVTSEDQGTITIVADLFDFGDMGIDILTPSDVADNDPGAAVEVFVRGQSVGYAEPVALTDNTIFTFDFGGTDLSEGLNVVTAAVRMFDAKTVQADGRGPMSSPLLLTLDTTAPSPPVAPDLLASSDTGMNDDDNVTNKTQPAFAGSTENNAKVRVKADGVVVGQGQATSNGNWEVTVEPLDDGVHDMTVEAEDLAGNVSVMSLATTIEIDTLSPNTPFLDLVEADDSGRHNDDNITNVNTPLLSATTHDPDSGIHIFADNFNYRIYDRLEESVETLIFDSFAVTSAFTSLAQILTTATLLDASSILGPLVDGFHNLKLEVEDRAGNISDDYLLDLLIDTEAPTGTARLHPDSDTGIWGFPETMEDGITSDMTPSLVGETEANALVRAEIDGDPAGTAVAIPLDGDDAFPPPPEFVGNYRLDTILNLDDGDHTITVFFRDVAGNETEADDAPSIDIIVDTQGPRITNVTFDGTRSLFEPKPSEQGPDPLTGSIFIHFDELPDGNVVSEEGHYQLMGDASGNIGITEVIVDEGESTVELVFAAPLFDDRYTLWVSDHLSDSAGNPLDGESGALAPFLGQDAPAETPPIFPTGDGVHGGDFHARFTIDSRPEIATYLGDGTWYVDLNGNGVFDPDNTDATNRDIVWKFGTQGDLPVTGDWNGDGYDEIGVLGKRGGKDFFFLDLDRNGALDLSVDAGFEFKMQGAGNGLPVSGDWDQDGSDEVAAFKGNAWFIDDTGTPYNSAVPSIAPTRIATSMRGLPIAGDWDGDGIDNVGTFDADQFFLDTDEEFSDPELTVNFPEFDFGGLKPQPVAHDWDQDGDDDIGLFVRRETGNNSGAREAGEWFLDVNTDLSGVGTVDARFEPPPTGQPGVPLVNQDLFYNFGDEREPAGLDGLRPVVGNFDPPLVGVTPTSLTNELDPLDTNLDRTVTALDALIIINALARTEISGESPSLYDSSDRYRLDASQDGVVTALDALLVINGLARQYLNVAAAEQVPPQAADWFAANDVAISEMDDDDELMLLLASDLRRF